MSEQRELMRQLWAQHSGDTARIIKEYAAAESEGHVPRRSNQSSLSPINYAKRLLADGQRKGWLGNIHSFDEARRATRQEMRAEAQSLPAVAESRGKWLSKWFSRLGCSESHEYLERVAAWRNAWRPERVRVLLLAESHVAEEHGDLTAQVHVPDWMYGYGLPEGFCRLVYCLGYGETEICRPVSGPRSNGGTWQFWDLFGAVASVFEPSFIKNYAPAASVLARGTAEMEDSSPSRAFKRGCVARRCQHNRALRSRPEQATQWWSISPTASRELRALCMARAAKRPCQSCLGNRPRCRCGTYRASTHSRRTRDQPAAGSRPPPIRKRRCTPSTGAFTIS